MQRSWALIVPLDAGTPPQQRRRRRRPSDEDGAAMEQQWKQQCQQHAQRDQQQHLDWQQHAGHAHLAQQMQQLQQLCQQERLLAQMHMVVQHQEREHQRREWEQQQRQQQKQQLLLEHQQRQQQEQQRQQEPQQLEQQQELQQLQQQEQQQEQQQLQQQEQQQLQQQEQQQELQQQQQDPAYQELQQQLRRQAEQHEATLQHHQAQQRQLAQELQQLRQSQQLLQQQLQQQQEQQEEEEQPSLPPEQQQQHEGLALPARDAACAPAGSAGDGGPDAARLRQLLAVLYVERRVTDQAGLLAALDELAALPPLPHSLAHLRTCSHCNSLLHLNLSCHVLSPLDGPPPPAPGQRPAGRVEAVQRQLVLCSCCAAIAGGQVPDEGLLTLPRLLPGRKPPVAYRLLSGPQVARLRRLAAAVDGVVLPTYEELWQVPPSLTPSQPAWQREDGPAADADAAVVAAGAGCHSQPPPQQGGEEEQAAPPPPYLTASDLRALLSMLSAEHIAHVLATNCGVQPAGPLLPRQMADAVLEALQRPPIKTVKAGSFLRQGRLYVQLNPDDSGRTVFDHPAAAPAAPAPAPAAAWPPLPSLEPSLAERGSSAHRSTKQPAGRSKKSRAAPGVCAAGGGLDTEACPGAPGIVELDDAIMQHLEQTTSSSSSSSNSSGIRPSQRQAVAAGLNAARRRQLLAAAGAAGRSGQAAVAVALRFWAWLLGLRFNAATGDVLVWRVMDQTLLLCGNEETDTPGHIDMAAALTHLLPLLLDERQRPQGELAALAQQAMAVWLFLSPRVFVCAATLQRLLQLLVRQKEARRQRLQQDRSKPAAAAGAAVASAAAGEQQQAKAQAAGLTSEQRAILKQVQARQWRLTPSEMREVAALLGPADAVLIEQTAGTAVDVRPGWLHWVANLQPCVKVAFEVLRVEQAAAVLLMHQRLRNKMASLPEDYQHVLANVCRELLAWQLQ